jgi:hypothetical protein
MARKAEKLMPPQLPLDPFDQIHRHLGAWWADPALWTPFPELIEQLAGFAPLEEAHHLDPLPDDLGMNGDAPANATPGVIPEDDRSRGL